MLSFVVLALCLGFFMGLWTDTIGTKAVSVYRINEMSGINNILLGPNTGNWITNESGNFCFSSDGETEYCSTMNDSQFFTVIDLVKRAAEHPRQTVKWNGDKK